MIEWLLKKITSRLNYRVIETDGNPYLTRWYLWPGAPRKGKDDVTPEAPFAVFIHFFHRGDEDRDEHNHPWRESLGIPLLHGYREQRTTRVHSSDVRSIVAVLTRWLLGLEIPLLVSEYTERPAREFRPGSINVIRGDDFHRVELLRPDKGCWTLFIAGPNVKDWGFRDRDTGEIVPWQAYLMRKAWRKPTT